MNIQDVKQFRAGLRALEREIGDQIKKDVTCCGVRQDECHTLMELDDENEMSLKDLSERLDTDKGNLSRTIDRLVKIGFVRRAGSPSDRRQVLVSLTEKGRIKAASIHEICNPEYQELFSYIPEEKHDAVIEGIKLLADGLSRMKKKRENASCIK